MGNSRIRTHALVALTTLLLSGAAACVAWAVERDEPAPPARVDLSAVRERAASMPIDARKETDKRIAVTVARVNNEASAKGQSVVASRLAGEFSMKRESLMEEKSEYGWSWGDLLIAHTLLANAGVKVTLRDLADLRSDGLSWGAIAFGLEFHLEDFEDVVKAGGRVATGLSKSAGKSGGSGE